MRKTLATLSVVLLVVLALAMLAGRDSPRRPQQRQRPPVRGRHPQVREPVPGHWHYVMPNSPPITRVTSSDWIEFETIFDLARRGDPRCTARTGRA